MTNAVRDVLGYALIPSAAIIVGGATALVRPPGPRVRSCIQHFAAGVVFAAVAVELLPDVLHERAPVAAVIGFALGIGLMLLIERLTRPSGAADKLTAARPTGLLVTLGVDIITDGLLIGIAFAAGSQQGVLVTLALTIEVLFLGLAAATALVQTGTPARTVMLVTAGLAALLLLGATLGAAVFGGFTGARLEVVLAFGSAALLYLVTEELLVEAHEVPETPVTTTMFFGGFLLLLVLEMLA